jgi:hypothetical protein
MVSSKTSPGAVITANAEQDLERRQLSARAVPCQFRPADRTWMRCVQIGFARVNRDYATHAHVGDVFVLAEYRG